MMLKQLIQSVIFRTRPTNAIFNVTPTYQLTNTRPDTVQRNYLSTESQHQKDDEPQSDMDDPFVGEKPKCILCQHDVPVSYKNPQLLSQFISPNTGHIYGQYITKLCKMQQRRVSAEIRKARVLGFMPVMHRDIIFLKDPDLFGNRYTGNVNIGDVIKLEPREQIVLTANTKKPSGKHSKKSSERKKSKKK